MIRKGSGKGNNMDSNMIWGLKEIERGKMGTVALYGEEWEGGGIMEKVARYERKWRRNGAVEREQHHGM